jgi:hypothetical protein
MKTKQLEKLPTVNFDALSDEEKERIYQECEKIGPDDGEPLTAADRRLHALAARRGARGRPKVGRGTKRVQVTIEASLLKRVDKRAEELGMSRARFLARAAEKMLSNAA